MPSFLPYMSYSADLPLLPSSFLSSSLSGRYVMERRVPALLLLPKDGAGAAGRGRRDGVQAGAVRQAGRCRWCRGALLALFMLFAMCA